VYVFAFVTLACQVVALITKANRPPCARKSFSEEVSAAEGFVVPPKSWRVSYAASGLVLDSLIS
jgi:hypothetical protein